MSFSVNNRNNQNSSSNLLSDTSEYTFAAKLSSNLHSRPSTHHISSNCPRVLLLEPLCLSPGVDVPDQAPAFNLSRRHPVRIVSSNLNSLFQVRLVPAQSPTSRASLHLAWCGRTGSSTCLHFYHALSSFTDPDRRIAVNNRPIVFSMLFLLSPLTPTPQFSR